MGTVQSENVDQNEDLLKRYYCTWCQKTKLLTDTPVADAEVLLIFRKFKRSFQLCILIYYI